MTNFFNKFPWATAMMFVLVTVAAVGGAAAVIWGRSGTLTFEQYLRYMKDFAFAVAGLGVARGIHAGLRDHGLGPASETPAAWDASGAGLGLDAAHYGEDPVEPAPTARRAARPRGHA